MKLFTNLRVIINAYKYLIKLDGIPFEKKKKKPLIK